MKRKSEKVAIVTLAVGEPYTTRWRQYCEPNWKRYAKSNGYDLICLDQPIDNSTRAQGRSVAWQKCLVLSQNFSAQYDRIVWIDSDIVINPSSPAITDGVAIDRVGAVAAYSLPTRELFLRALDRINDLNRLNGVAVAEALTPDEYHGAFGLSGDQPDVVQTGVLVLSPKHHREILEKVYNEYEDRGPASWHYEMRPLSYELQKACLVHWIDHRFNQGWLTYQITHFPFLLNEPRQRTFAQRVFNRLQRTLKIESMPQRLRRACATTAYLNSYFLHFAGGMNDAALIDQSVESWTDILLSSATAGTIKPVAQYALPRLASLAPVLLNYDLFT